jgi:hypothetical protein
MSHEPQIRKFTCRCTRLGFPGEFAAEVRAQVLHDLLQVPGAGQLVPVVGDESHVTA